MKVEKTTTGIIIRQPSDDIKRKCLQYFSLNNPTREYFIYSGNDPDKKFIFGGERDVIYITSGFGEINDSTCKSLSKHQSVITPREGAKVSFEMKYPPRSQFQIDCIKKLTESKSNKITVEAKPGLGKEEPYSRKIPTPTSKGYTLMGDLKLGDFVFGRDGNPTEVEGIFEQGEKDVFKLTFEDGRTAYCGEEHLWTVRSEKNGKWQTVMLKDMITDFKRLSSLSQSGYQYKYHVPICEPVKYPKRKLPIDPWVFGCFIGNGVCMSKVLTINSYNYEIPKRIAEICNFDFQTSKSFDYAYTFYDKKSGKPIRTKDFFKEIPDMIYCYSRDKVIPNNYMFNDIESRTKLLQGLLDSDGCITNAIIGNYTTLSSTSKKLIQQVLQLLYSLGYTGNTMPDNDRTIMISPVIDLGTINGNVDNNDLLITDICFSHREKCRCIMVANEEHLYLTEDYIVTHNTFIALASISKLGLKPLIIVPTTLLKNQWIENLNELGIDSNDIATKMIDAPDKKFCVVTISSIETLIRDDWKFLLDTLNKANFGIKIIDEAHLHLKGVLKLDAISNIKHNWYLSATLGRSNISEDNILNRALKDAERFIGNATYEEYQHEYVNVYLQDIYYHPSAKLCDEHFKYGSKGLVRATYYNMLMNYKGGKPFMNNIITMTKRAREISNYGKILILVPIITAIDMVLKYMKADPWFNKFTFAGVNGTMPMAQRKAAMDCDIIVSTSMSMGTGVDIKDLAVVINFDQYASPIITEQIFGRLRTRKDEKETHYFDICDYVKYAKTISNWGRKRRVLIPYFPGANPTINRLKKISV